MKKLILLRYLVGTPGVLTFDLAGYRVPKPDERVIGIRTRIDEDLIRRRPAKSETKDK